MSQNRPELRDRLNAEHDYQVNLDTEMEIHQLHIKIDHLLFNQGQRLLEIQKIQVELKEKPHPENPMKIERKTLSQQRPKFPTKELPALNAPDRSTVS